MIQFYHPSKSGKGSAASFWYSSRNNAVLATIIKQSGWDNEKDNGLFQDKSPSMKVNIKLSQVEVAAILDCIERNREFKTTHDFAEKFTHIGFKPARDKTDASIQIGYDFSFTVADKQDPNKKDSFFIRFNFPEARLIREQLIHFLHEQFDNVNKTVEKSSTVNEPQQAVEEETTEQSETTVSSLDDL